MIAPHPAKLAVTFVAAMAWGSAAPVNAQAPEARAIGEVIVTAQKREQRLQDVPIAIVALGGAALERAGVRDLKDMQLLTSGLIVTSTTSNASTTIRIRGVGTVGDNPGLEPSVGVVVDGVYRPRNGVGFGDLGELDRIEVLKGPQGTLFGKSTSAGLVNVVTAAPSFSFGAVGEATIGNYDARGFSASVTGPLAENLAGRIFFTARKRDGFMSVITGPGPRTKTTDDDLNYFTGRGQLLFTPTGGARIRVIADYSKRKEFCCLAVQTVIGSSPVSRAVLLNQVRPGAEPLTPNPFARVAYANRESLNRVTDKGVSIQADVPVGHATLTSISALRDWLNRRGGDWDFTAADIFYRPESGFYDRFRTATQEFRLSGRDGRVNWLVGGFAAREVYDGQSDLLFGADYYGFLAGKVLGGAPSLIGAGPATTFTPGSGQRDRFRQVATTWALFTDNTLSITDDWDLTAGFRYTVDRKRLDSTISTSSGACRLSISAFPALVGAVGAARAAPVVGGMCLPWANELLDARSGRQAATEREGSGSIKTSYRVTPSVMTYASYGRGYKAGGYNFDRPSATLAVGAAGLALNIANTTRFAAETSNAFELGAKTQWFERRLTLNLALFHQTYSNFQLNTFLGTSFIVESIPRVRSQGADLDVAYVTPIEGLKLQGGLTYALTEYGTFGAADLTDPGRFAGLNRLPGARISFAPLWSASGTVSYDTPLGSSGLIGGASLSTKYNSRYNTGSDLAPQKNQPAFALFNIKTVLGAADQSWAIEAWSLNLTNRNYIQAAFNSPLQGTETDATDIRTYSAFLGQPRTYGVTLRLRR